MLLSGGDIENVNECGSTQLHRACQGGYLPLVTLLLEHKADVHARDHSGFQPIHSTLLLVARFSRIEFVGYDAMESKARLEIIRALLLAGADLSARTANGATPLSLAYIRNSSEILHLLLQKGADPHTRNVTSQRAFDFSTSLLRGIDGIEVVADLLRNGVGLNRVEENGDTLLDCAAWIGSTSAVKALLRNGAHPDIAGRYGRSALYYAGELMQNIEGGDVIRSLIDKGASLGSDDDALCRAAELGSPCTFLLLLDLKIGLEVPKSKSLRHCAKLLFHPEGGGAIKALLAAGATVNPSYSPTPLHFAAMNGSARAVHFLLDYGADRTLKMHPEDEIPLHFAAKLGEDPDGVEAITELLRSDSEVQLNARDRCGNTPLHTAADNGSPLAVKLLLEAGASVLLRNNQGLTPLHLASGSGSPETINILLAAGSDLCSIDYYTGNTPLHIAVQRRSIPCVQRLIQLGASVNFKNRLGQSPLHTLASGGKGEGGEEILRALLDGNAELESVNVKGSTPLEEAGCCSSPHSSASEKRRELRPPTLFAPTYSGPASISWRPRASRYHSQKSRVPQPETKSWVLVLPSLCKTSFFHPR